MSYQSRVAGNPSTCEACSAKPAKPAFPDTKRVKPPPMKKKGKPQPTVSNRRMPQAVSLETPLDDSAIAATNAAHEASSAPAPEGSALSDPSVFDETWEKHHLRGLENGPPKEGESVSNRNSKGQRTKRGRRQSMRREADKKVLASDETISECGEITSVISPLVPPPIPTPQELVKHLVAETVRQSQVETASVTGTEGADASAGMDDFSETRILELFEKIARIRSELREEVEKAINSYIKDRNPDTREGREASVALINGVLEQLDFAIMRKGKACRLGQIRLCIKGTSKEVDRSAHLSHFSDLEIIDIYSLAPRSASYSPVPPTWAAKLNSSNQSRSHDA
jgi:hypothetical protein